MKATSGDWLIVESGQTGGARRTGEILEVHGDGGAPPFVVRWADGDHESLVFPGPDAHVVPADQMHAADGG